MYLKIKQLKIINKKKHQKAKEITEKSIFLPFRDLLQFLQNSDLTFFVPFFTLEIFFQFLPFSLLMWTFIYFLILMNLPNQKSFNHRILIQNFKRFF